MQFQRRNMNSVRTAAMLAVGAAAWLFVASAPAQESHSPHTSAVQTHGAGEADHGPDVADAASHGEGHAYSGLTSDLPFWGVIAFVGFIFAIRKLGWGAFTSGLQGREAEELRLIAEAEDLRRQAAEQLHVQRGQMEALDEEIRAVLAEADRDADHTRRDIRAAADREAATARARVELEISRVKDQTLSELFENFTQRVIDATQDRLRGRLDAAAQDTLIDAALAEFAAGHSK